MLLSSNNADDSLPKYAALHRYLPGNGCGSSEEWQAARDTPWGNSIRAVIDREGRSRRTEWTFQQT